MNDLRVLIAICKIMRFFLFCFLFKIGHFQSKNMSKEKENNLIYVLTIPISKLQYIYAFKKYSVPIVLLILMMICYWMSNPQNLGTHKRKYREDKLLWQTGKGPKPEYREKYERILPISLKIMRENSVELHRNQNFEFII